MYAKQDTQRSMASLSSAVTTASKLLASGCTMPPHGIGPSNRSGNKTHSVSAYLSLLETPIQSLTSLGRPLNRETKHPSLLIRRHLFQQGCRVLSFPRF